MYGTQQAKYKKYHKQKIRRISIVQPINEPIFGTCGIQTAEAGRFAASHFDSARRTIRRHVKRSGKIWFLGNPNLPVTKKPTTIRMGKGKGSVEFWSRPTRAGSTILEIAGPNTQQAIRVLNVIKKKIPMKANLIWQKINLHS